GVTGATRWDIATDVEWEPEKWRQHRAMLDAHRPFRNFVYTINGAGSPAYVQTSGKPIHDASGNFLGYRGTGTNITRKIRAGQLEEALQEAKVSRPVRIRSLPRHREGQWKGHAGQEPTLNL